MASNTAFGKIRILISSGGLVLGIISMASSNDARAETIGVSLRAQATSYCQTALPSFDGQVRKRPLAFTNEGTSTAFVTCAFARNFNTGSPLAVLVYTSNSNAAPQNLTCTLVTGVAAEQNAEFLPKTVTLGAGEVGRLILWTATDFGPHFFPNTQVSMSCALPTGVSLNDSGVLVAQGVGF